MTASVDDGSPSLILKAELRDDRTYVIEVEGEVDMATAPDLQTSLLDAARSSATAVLVDLSGCEFLDSSGLTVLVRASRDLNEQGLGLALIALNRPVLKAFEVSRLDGMFEIHPDKESYDASRTAS